MPESTLPPPYEAMPDEFQPATLATPDPPASSRSTGWRWLSRSLAMALIASIAVVSICAQVIAIKTGGGTASIGVDLDNVIMTSIATLGALGAATNSTNQS